MKTPKKNYYRAIDGPLSSVLLNCLQVTCFFPQRRTFSDYESNGDLANWMSKVDVPLKQLVVPGTHDSATGTIGRFKPFSAAGRTQNLSILDQLQNGARYVDLRVASGSSRDFSIWHGCLEGGDFEDTIKSVRGFVENRNELVIVEITPEYGKPFDKDRKKRCMEKISEILQGYVLDSKNLTELMNTPVSEILRTQSKRVVVLIHNRFYENDKLEITPDELKEKFGFAYNNEYWINPWNNTRDIDDLLDKNLKNVEKFKNQKTRFLNCQVFCTPKVEGLPDVLNLLAGRNSLRPVSHACKLYESNVLDKYLRDHANQPWNIISLDFIELCPDIVDFLISLNYSEISINLAVVRVDGIDSDVSSSIGTFVARNKVLFLVDPQQDLGIDSSFCLTVAYSVNKTHHIVQIDVEGDRPVLISEFGCNSESKTIQLTDSGIFYKGSMFETVDKVDKGSHTTLECTVGDDSCAVTLVE